MMLVKSIFCLLGPTATGKTALAIKLTENFPFAIISVDSGMVYRGMDIGTAKPTPTELKKVPHRLVNIRDPIESYSAGQFRQDALMAIEDIFAAGKIPLLVGGTMLYFWALQQGIAVLPTANEEVRKKIKQQQQTMGLNALYQKLQTVDPQTAAIVHNKDKQRIQRALEVFMLTGRKMSELRNISSTQALPYTAHNFALMPGQRTSHHAKINLRFKDMLRLGLLAEVEQLYKRGDLHLDLPAIRMVGYRQVWRYFMGLITYQQMLEQIPRATCQLAKRQLTWLRNWSKVKCFASESKHLLAEISKEIHIIQDSSG